MRSETVTETVAIKTLKGIHIKTLSLSLSHTLFWYLSLIISLSLTQASMINLRFVICSKSVPR